MPPQKVIQQAQEAYSLWDKKQYKVHKDEQNMTRHESFIQYVRDISGKARFDRVQVFHEMAYMFQLSFGELSENDLEQMKEKLRKFRHCFYIFTDKGGYIFN